MARYVIEPEVALLLAARGARPAGGHRLLAPTLLRSQVLARLYAQVGRGELTRAEASRRLDHLRALQVRLLGDRVLQRVAWDIALELGWPDTFVAEYLALTRLQADALVTTSPELARAARAVVPVASIDDLLAGTA
jgi:predicted nucleic acid-binding protein